MKYKLLKIFLLEKEKVNGKLLYEEILRVLKEKGFNGATILRGIEGFGRRREIHRFDILRMSEDLPIVIEVVNSEEKLSDLLPALKPLLNGHLVITTDIDVIDFDKV